MTADQLTTLLEAFGGFSTLLAGFAMRWLSRAGRTVRRLRASNEDKDEVIFKTREMAMLKGVARADLPRMAEEKRVIAERRASLDLAGVGDDEADN